MLGFRMEIELEGDTHKMAEINNASSVKMRPTRDIRKKVHFPAEWEQLKRGHFSRRTEEKFGFSFS